MTDSRFAFFRSLHAAAVGAAAPAIALCAAIDLPEGDSAPDWIHLLPAGEIRTGDGRGPYRVRDHVALMARSLLAGDRLPIDENHATDLAAPRGEPAPVRGWIVELQHRADGVWGRVEWTAQGRRLVAGRAYRGISPVMEHTGGGDVLAIRRASLTNRPNLRGLAALHQEGQDMTLLERLRAVLALPATAGEEEAIASVTALHASQAQATTSLQAALDPIATRVGLQAGASATAVLAGVEQLASRNGGGDDVVTALQSELASVTIQLNTLLSATKRNAAVSYVDGEIKRGRVGLKPVRDRYVALHMENPANAQALIEAMPVLGGGGQIVPATPPVREGEISLHAEQVSVARMLGLDPKDYAATLQIERAADEETY